MDNQLTEAAAYIKHHLANGFSEAKIRQHFLDNGWTPSLVDQAFSAALPKHTANHGRPLLNRLKQVLKKFPSLQTPFLIPVIVVLVVLITGLSFAGTKVYSSLTSDKLVNCGTTVENQGSASVSVSGSSASSSTAGEKLNSCFEKRFSQCKPATVTYTYPDNVPLLGGVEAKYTIIGKASGGCSMQSVYPKYPISAAFQNKTLTCTYDNKNQNSWAAENALTSTNFKGCSGPLYQLLKGEGTSSSNTTLSTTNSTALSTPPSAPTSTPSTTTTPPTTSTPKSTTTTPPTSTSTNSALTATISGFQTVDGGSIPGSFCAYNLDYTIDLSQAANIVVYEYDKTNNSQINTESPPNGENSPYPYNGQGYSPNAGSITHSNVGGNLFSTEGISGIVASVYIQVYSNDGNGGGSLLATSPTVTFNCP